MIYLSSFQNSTYTHCEVSNFAPSISASIGSFVPQRYIWQCCIAFHSAPRFLFALLQGNHLRERLRSPVRPLVHSVVFGVQCVENLSLVALTIVSSQENFPVHKTAFTLFVVASFVYMSSVVYLVTKYEYASRNQYERTGLVWKKRLLTGSLVAGALMFYFYWRHNEYCEPYVYSFFCLCEYFIVVFNIGFHATAYFDFYAADCQVSRSAIGGYLPLSLVT